MTASLAGYFNFQALTDAGAPAVGHRLYTYSPSTTTHKAAYTDTAGTPHTYTSDGSGGQYIALNSRGELPAPLFLAAGGYDLTLKTSAGASVWTRRAYGNDADQMQLDLTATGAVDTMVAPYLNLMVQGAKRTFGCAGDGSTDDATRLNNALQTSGKIIELEAGTYLFNSALTAPICSGIVGEGEYVSTLQPGASVATALSIGSTGPALLKDFGLNGSLTSGKVGLLLGSSLTAVNASSIRSTAFGGSGAKAIWIADLLKSNLTKLTVGGGSGRGLHIEQITPIGLPTTLNIDTFTASSVTGPGVRVIGGKVRFTNACIESCTEEGLLVDLSVAGADDADLVFAGGWFEANQGNDTSKYHAVVNSGPRTCRVNFDGTYFDTNGSTAAKAIHYSGASVRSNVNRPVFGQSVAGAILVDSSAILTVDGWSSNFTKACVTNSGGTLIWDEQRLDEQEAAWTAYTPTYTSSSGDATATWSGGAGGVTTTLARYKVIGKTLYLQLQFSGTLNAITPSFLGVSLPGSYTAQGSGAFTSTLITTGGANETGYVRTVGTGVLRFQRAAGGNFGSAGAAGGWANLVVEVA